MSAQQFVGYNEKAELRTRRHEQIVAAILNSLIRQGLLVQSGQADWSLVGVGGTQGPTGQGVPGPRGPDGTRWLKGQGAPSPLLGTVGDLYLDTVRADVYTKSIPFFGVPASWGFLVNLKGGPPGRDGKDGKNGIGVQGPAGAAGATGAPGGALALIQTQTLSGAVATVTFSSIPAVYNHLKLCLLARETAADSSQSVNMNFNGDSGANYILQQIQGNGSVGSALEVQNATTIAVCDIAGGNATAAMCGVCDCTILGYAQTTFDKIAVSSGMLSRGTTGATSFKVERGGTWRSTAAINSIALTCSGGANFATGSIFSLYGMS